MGRQAEIGSPRSTKSNTMAKEAMKEEEAEEEVEEDDDEGKKEDTNGGEDEEEEEEEDGWLAAGHRWPVDGRRADGLVDEEEEEEEKEEEEEEDEEEYGRRTAWPADVFPDSLDPMEDEQLLHGNQGSRDDGRLIIWKEEGIYLGNLKMIVVMFNSLFVVR